MNAWKHNVDKINKHIAKQNVRDIREEVHNIRQMGIPKKEKRYLLQSLYTTLTPYKKKRLQNSFGDVIGTPPVTVAPMAPVSVAPTTLAPTTMAPETQAPVTMAPATMAPATMAPATMAPQTAPVGQTVVGAPPNYNQIAATAERLAMDAANIANLSAAAQGQGSFGRWAFSN